jgi:hypothetical protein
MAAALRDLTQLGAEFALLAKQSGRVLRQLWAAILGLMLLGWSAQQLSVMLSAELISTAPWLVIAVLAAGVVAQLACVLAVLRLAGVRLGLPSMLTWSSEAGLQDQRDTSLVNLLTITLLPFLGMYAAFGYVQTYAAEVSILDAYRDGNPDLISALNPNTNTATLYLMSAIIIGGFAFKRLSDLWERHTHFPRVVGMIKIYVEAAVLIAVLLGGFRIFSDLKMWLMGTNLYAWRDHAVQWAAGLLHLDLPVVLVTIWNFLVSVAWPFVAVGIARPLLWLVMAGLVFGSKVLSLADLWQLGAPQIEANNRRQRALAKLRADTAAARGVRQIALKTQTVVLQDFDDTVLPALHSLRLIARSGWPFIGAYLIAFTLLDLAGNQLDVWTDRLLGGHSIDFWIQISPALGFVNQVVVMGITWVLLSAAYTRVLSISTDQDDPAATPVLAHQTGRLSPVRANRFTLVPALAIAVVVALVVGGARSLPTTAGEDVKSAGIMAATWIHEQRVVVDNPRLAKSVVELWKPETTDLIFVVATVGVYSPGPHPETLSVELVSGKRTYLPWNRSNAPAARPGFMAIEDRVFEVDPADITADARLKITPVDRRGLIAYHQTLEVGLNLTPKQLASPLPKTDLVYGEVAK